VQWSSVKSTKGREAWSTPIDRRRKTLVPGGAVGRLRERFPRVRFLTAPPGTGVFRLRTMGIEATSGVFVAMTEDHCTFAPGWLDALRAGLRDGHAIVGGPVENGLPDRAYDSALYLCEYAAHMPPLAGGTAPALSGVNVAYDRGALLACREVWRQAFYENEVHDALRAAGHRPYRSAAAVVTTHLSLPLRAAAAHLFRGGRRFGGYRRAHASPALRAVLPVGALAVPGLLTWRALRAVASRRPQRLGTAVRGLGYILALNSAWAAGEAVGYLPGARPGGAAETG
jgi:hypothetical protein